MKRKEEKQARREKRSRGEEVGRKHDGNEKKVKEGEERDRRRRDYRENV